MSLFESASLVVTPNGTKASKLYSVKPADGSGDMTVTRATTATRVNSSGIIESVATNVPRLDYTGSTCPSVLIEPQRTNLVLRSEEFDNASWVKFNATVTANSTISPDGTLDADKIIGSAGISNNNVYQSPSLTANTQYTETVYAKKSEWDWIVLEIRGEAVDAVVAWFNVNTGTVGVIKNGGTATITNVGNGWYRCSLTRTMGATTSSTRVRIYTTNANDSYSVGDGTSGVFIWGAQLEAGSSATSYIPTTNATVTRNADLISKTGITDLIGQTEGTLYAEVNNKNWETSNRIFIISDGSANNRIGIVQGTSQNTLRFLISTSGASQTDVNSSSIISSNYKIAIAYKNNDISIYVNGVQIATDTSATIPACSNVYLGKSESLSLANIINNGIKSAALWKTRLTNAELATLTTL